MFKNDNELVSKPKSKNLIKAFDLLVSIPKNFRVAGREDTKAKNDATKPPNYHAS